MKSRMQTKENYTSDNFTFETCVVAEKNKTYGYSDAIALTGNGWYNFGLLLTLSLALLAMALDMFSFAMVVTLSSEDLQLTVLSKQILVSMPFVGPILMAYAWGYLSDTQGRKSSLLVALIVSFAVSTLGAFSPHWSMLAVTRFLSTCFCSCAQSATITLIGESCPDRVKGVYMLVMTSIIHINLVLYYPIAYFITRLDIYVPLGFINFVPWRLLVIVLALPLGISAVCLMFFYESPKFLINAGREKEALEVLEKIHRRNNGASVEYPVKKVALMETGNVRSDKTLSFAQSLWQQTYPLFTPPLLFRTLMLYYIIFALYSVNSALIVWLPFLAQSFSRGLAPSGNGTRGLCTMIAQQSLQDSGASVIDKSSHIVDLPIVIISICAGFCYCILSMVISLFAGYKRLLLLIVFTICGLCGFGCLFITKNVAGVILYFGILLNSLNMGVSLAYCVDFYPTSFRGMGACLAVMMARVSGIIGVNAIGPFISTQCEPTFWALSLIMLSAAAMAYFFPKDQPKKITS